MEVMTRPTHQATAAASQTAEVAPLAAVAEGDVSEDDYSSTIDNMSVDEMSAWTLCQFGKKGQLVDEEVNKEMIEPETTDRFFSF